MQNSIRCKAFNCYFLGKEDNISEKIISRIISFILKTNISDIYRHKYIRIKINLDHDLALEKPLNIHNSVILIKSVFNKNYSHYFYQEVVEKKLYE